MGLVDWKDVRKRHKMATQRNAFQVGPMRKYQRQSGSCHYVCPCGKELFDLSVSEAHVGLWLIVHEPHTDGTTIESLEAKEVVMSEPDRNHIDRAITTLKTAQERGFLSRQDYAELADIKEVNHLIVSVRHESGKNLGHHVCKTRGGCGTSLVEEVTCPQCLEWLSK
jgi:hypothetical protein